MAAVAVLEAGILLASPLAPCLKHPRGLGNVCRNRSCLRRAPCAIVTTHIGERCSQRRARDELSGDPAQRRGVAVRRIENRRRADQSVPRRRGRQRGRVPARARHRCRADRPDRRQPHPPGRAGPHLPHRRHPGSGRTGPDAQRAPQGGASLRDLSRRARPRTRQGGGRAGQTSRPGATHQIRRRHIASDRHAAARRHHRGSVRRARRCVGRRRARRDAAQSLRRHQ